jgi:UDP-glucose 4-epimerase
MAAIRTIHNGLVLLVFSPGFAKNSMAILITGGAGYIGTHMVYAALERGEEVVVLDDLSTGVRGLVAERAQFCQGDVGDQELLRKLIARYRITAVVHFAASTVLPESVEKPLAYYANNTVASHNLIEVCVETGVKHFVFSSTAAVYAGTDGKPVTEDAPLAPGTPYGRSKLMTEWMLEDAARAHDLTFITLRYFNVAGADPKGRTGQSTPRATHLIKRACQAALGRIPYLEIYGTDYPTRDGTGVRDYIHVTDLVDAHTAALEHLFGAGGSLTLNCGYGRGFSVSEVIAAVTRVAGRPVPTREAPPRRGDMAEIVADPTKLQRHLSWRPNHENLDEIVRTALEWERRANSI